MLCLVCLFSTVILSAFVFYLERGEVGKNAVWSFEGDFCF